MIALPSGMSAHDVSQWLSDGVFLARRNSNAEWRPCTLLRFEDGIRVRDVATREAFTANPDNIRAHWPVCGAVNLLEGPAGLPPFAVYVRRLQRKQYRRTYNNGCLRVSVMRTWQHLKMYPRELLNVHPMSNQVINAAFFPTYPTLDEAQKMMRDGRVSVALDPNIILVSGPDVHVYYKEVYAGTLQEHMFVPECDDVVAEDIREALFGGINEH